MSKKMLVQSLLTRIFHWSFAFCVILLLISGFNIHDPFRAGGFYEMKMNIFLQTVLGFIATGIFAFWIYHHIVTQAYKDILIRRRDLKDFVGLLKYYLFIEKKSPAHGKYNAGQRFVYSSWIVSFFFMSLTGIILHSSNFGNVIPFPITLQKVRFYHFLVSWWFLATVPLHIYLVLTEDPAKLQSIFTGWVKKTGK